MTVTVGGLLERLHVIAGALPPHGGRGAEAIERDWRELARTMNRALGTLPIEDGSTVAFTRELAQNAFQGLAGGRWGDERPPDSRLIDMAIVTGAVSDILVANRRPFTVTPPAYGVKPRRGTKHPWAYVERPPDNAAAAPLLTSLLAAAGTAAAWSLDAVSSEPAAAQLTRNLLNVVLLTQSARSQPRQGSFLEHLSVTHADDRSLSGAIQRWGSAAELALDRSTLTAGTFAMMASDLWILGGALAVVAPPESPPELAAAIRSARVEWKGLASWPAADLQLAGRRHEGLVAASRDVRAGTRELLYSPQGWRTPEEVARRYGRGDLDTLAYTLATTTSRTAAAFSEALLDAGAGHGRFWLSIDSALEIAPRTPTTRTWRNPKRLVSTELPRRWVRIREVGDGVRDLVSQAKAAAASTQEAAHQVERALTIPPANAPKPSYEVIAINVGPHRSRPESVATGQPRQSPSVAY